MDKVTLLTPKTWYKPFAYPWAYQAYKQQAEAFWRPTTVPMDGDLRQFQSSLSEDERKLIVRILKFFTQADIDVGRNYMNRLLGYFGPYEINMMLMMFGAFECIHVEAYAYLSDSLKLDKDPNFYREFLSIDSMRSKHEYLENLPLDSLQDAARVLAIFGGFIEGVQLYSSFAIINNFPRRGLLCGTGQIVTWSVRDESIHAKNITRLFRTLVEESPEIWTDEFKKSLYVACRDVVDLEDAFITQCFEGLTLPGLTAEDVKAYVRYMANLRIADLGLKPFYDVVENPLPWLDVMINGVEHQNFFEGRSTNYSMGNVIDDLER